MAEIEKQNLTISTEVHALPTDSEHCHIFEAPTGGQQLVHMLLTDASHAHLAHIFVTNHQQVQPANLASTETDHIQLAFSIPAGSNGAPLVQLISKESGDSLSVQS